MSAIRAVRFLVSNEGGSQNQDLDYSPLFRTGFVEKLVSYLQYGEYPDLAYECLWVLTNSCMGSNGEVDALLTVPNLLEVANNLIQAPIDDENNEMCSKQYMVKEQAMWLVANIAAENNETRQRVVSSGFVQSISNFMKTVKKVRRGILAVLSWALTNCLLNRQKVALAEFEGLTDIWISCLVLDNERLISDTLYGMAFFAEINDQHIEWLCSRGSLGFYHTVVMHIGNPNSEVHTPALRLCGNLCYGRDCHIERLI